MNQAKQKTTVSEAIRKHKELLFPAVAGLLLVFFCSPIFAQTPTTLEISKPVEREMKAGETQAYKITLSTGQKRIDI